MPDFPTGSRIYNICVHSSSLQLRIYGDRLFPSNKCHRFSISSPLLCVTLRIAMTLLYLQIIYKLYLKRYSFKIYVYISYVHIYNKSIEVLLYMSNFPIFAYDREIRLDIW